MPITRRLPNLHTCIALCIQSLDCTCKGACDGVANLGIEAILAENIKRFDKNIQLIRRVFFKSISDPAIVETGLSIKQFYKLCLEDNLNSDESELKEKFLDVLRQKLKALSSYNQEIIYKFLKGIVTYQNMHNTVKACKLVASPKIIKRGMIHEFSDFRRCPRTLEKMQKYLESLRTALRTARCSFAIRLTASGNEKSDLSNIQTAIRSDNSAVMENLGNLYSHAITVGFSSSQDEWIFIDANHLPIKIFKDDKKISEILRESYDSVSCDSEYEIKVLVTGNNKNLVESSLNCWRAQQRIEEIREKISQFDADFNTPKYFALRKLQNSILELKTEQEMLLMLKPFEWLVEATSRLSFCFNATQMEENKKDINSAYMEYADTKNNFEFDNVIKRLKLKLESRHESELQKKYFNETDHLNKHGLFAIERWIPKKIIESFCCKRKRAMLMS